MSLPLPAKWPFSMIFIPFSWILYREKARGTGGAPPRGNRPFMHTYNNRSKTMVWDPKPSYLTTLGTPYGGTPPYHGGPPPTGVGQKYPKKGKKSCLLIILPFGTKLATFCPIFAHFLPLFCHFLPQNATKWHNLGQKNATKRHKRA